MRSVAIIGASSAIATACARIWNQEPTRFHLVGRNIDKLERLAADLKVRNEQAEVELIAADLLNEAEIESVVGKLFQSEALDLALIAHGWLPNQQQAQGDLKQAKMALLTNGVSPALWAEALVGKMADRGKGTLAVLSSVAGERGRRSNYIYGAGKGLLTRYVQGLQHRFFGSDVRVVLIKPGPTDTPMTDGYQGPSPAPLDVVAKQIVHAIDSGRAECYAPGRWRLIMFALRLLPLRIFGRLRI